MFGRVGERQLDARPQVETQLCGQVSVVKKNGRTEKAIYLIAAPARNIVFVSKQTQRAVVCAVGEGNTPATAEKPDQPPDAPSEGEKMDEDGDKAEPAAAVAGVQNQTADTNQVNATAVGKTPGMTIRYDDNGTRIVSMQLTPGVEISKSTLTFSGFDVN